MMTAARPIPAVVYPCSDGKPMADNTLQYEWIVRLKGGFEASCPTAFVAGDLLWYFEEGNPAKSVAPDVLVVFGRPRGHRMSWLPWEENGASPQIVVEVWSPGNRWPERIRKHKLYEQLGVQEFIAYDPDANELVVYAQGPGGLAEVDLAGGWTSPLSGVRFVPGEKLEVYGPDGRRLPFFDELVAEREKAEAEREKAEAEREKAEAEREKAEAERAEADAARRAAEARAEALAAQLRALGIDPG
jgi:Uma2 family endonuclease